MIDLQSPFKVFIVGRTGSGKSWLAGAIAEQLFDTRRWLIFDFQSRNHLGLTAIRGVKLLVVKPNTQYDWKKLLTYDHVVVVPDKHTTREELIKQYLNGMGAVFDYDRNRVLFLEEAHNYMNTAKSAPEVELLLREGRHSKIDLIMLSQEFNKFAWSQCSHTITFKWANHVDVRYVSQTIPNFEELNRELGPHDAIIFDHKTLDSTVIHEGEISRLTKHMG